MRRWFILTLVLVGLCLPYVTHAQLKAPNVTVDGTATLYLAPDQGVITVGVTNQASTAAQASQANAAAMQKVVDVLKKALDGRGRLETAGYHLRPVTTYYKETRRSQITGYKADHQVRVTSRDPQALAGILDAAVAAGANQVSGPHWGLADPSQAERQALAAAFADAKARAQTLATAAGLALGPLQQMRTGGGVAAPVPMLRSMAKASENTPCKPAKCR